MPANNFLNSILDRSPPITVLDALAMARTDENVREVVGYVGKNTFLLGATHAAVRAAAIEGDRTSDSELVRKLHLAESLILSERGKLYPQGCEWYDKGYRMFQKHHPSTLKENWWQN